MIYDIDISYQNIQLLLFLWIIIFFLIIISPDSISRIIFFIIFVISYMIFIEVKIQIQLLSNLLLLNFIKNEVLLSIIPRVFYIESVLIIMNDIGILILFLSIILILYDIIK